MQPSKSTIITILVLVAVVVLAGVYTFYVRKSAQQNDVTPRTPAEAALHGGGRYTTLEGEMMDLSQYVGDGVLVINSWASWCPFCVNELPDFAVIADEYKDQKVTVIAINRKEGQRTANNFVKTLSGVESIIFALDPEDYFYSEIGGFTMPETLFYDLDGTVVVHKRGFMNLEEMRVHVEAALASNNQSL